MFKKHGSLQNHPQSHVKLTQMFCILVWIWGSGPFTKSRPSILPCFLNVFYDDFLPFIDGVRVWFCKRDFLQNQKWKAYSRGYNPHDFTRETAMGMFLPPFIMRLLTRVCPQVPDHMLHPSRPSLHHIAQGQVRRRHILTKSDRGGCTQWGECDRKGMSSEKVWIRSRFALFIDSRLALAFSMTL